MYCVILVILLVEYRLVVDRSGLANQGNDECNEEIQDRTVIGSNGAAAAVIECKNYFGMDCGPLFFYVLWYSYCEQKAGLLVSLIDSGNTTIGI